MVYDKSAYGYRVAGIGTVTSSEIVIPEFYEGLPVVYISSEAFKDNTKITKVTLSDMLEMIGESAFQGCTSLESVIFPEYGKLEIILKNAFSDCSSLKAVDIPDTVTYISKAVFENCINLEFAKLPKNLEIIDWFLFCNTPRLESVTLPDSLLAINWGAFSCSGIERIKIPKTVFGIYKEAFKDSCIASVEFEEGSAIELIVSSAFEECINLKSINIPESVTEIGEEAFKGCLSLKSITIPAGVTEIGKNAFEDCVNLKEVTFDKNSQIKTLGSFFYNTQVGNVYKRIWRYVVIKNCQVR